MRGIGEVLELSCLPGDIGLHVRLNDLAVHCFVNDDFINYQDIETISDGIKIGFCREGDPKQEFLDAIKRKEGFRAPPLSERTAGWI